VHDAELEMRMGEVQEALDEIEAFEMRLPDIAVSEPKTAQDRRQARQEGLSQGRSSHQSIHASAASMRRTLCLLVVPHMVRLTVVVVVERDGSLRMPCSTSTPRYRPSSLSAPSAWMIRER